MLTVAVRVRRKNLLAALAAVVLVASGVVLWGKGPAAAPVFLRRRAEAKCQSPSDGAAWLADQGVANGTSDTTFSPDSVCTRGQIVTFLYRAFAN